jgi:hypothetical protein
MSDARSRPIIIRSQAAFFALLGILALFSVSHVKVADDSREFDLIRARKKSYA